MSKTLVKYSNRWRGVDVEFPRDVELPAIYDADAR